MSKNYKISLILTLIGVFLIGIGIGYIWGEYKVNKCKTMSPEEAFHTEECREFYLGE